MATVFRSLVLVLLAAVLSCGQRVDVPWGGGGCATDWDCSLGGECVPLRPGYSRGFCKCDPWFTGLTCDLLNLQPPKNTEQGLCHKGFDAYHSWGGRALPETTTKVTESGEQSTETTWHLYASFLCDHQSLNKWTTISASAHFVSNSPVGPFEFSSEQCVGEVCTPTIIPWSHNTVALHDMNADKNASWQIWHIGDGIVNSSVFNPCFNKSEASTKFKLVKSEKEIEKESQITSERYLNKQPPKPNPGAETFVASAPTPQGPWVRDFANKPLNIKFDPSGAWPQSATNPAPLVLPNGSIRLYFTCGDDDKPCGLVSNCIGMAQSDNGWEGPFIPHPKHLTNLESEDSFVFIDPRGNFHMLTNINTCHARCPVGVECGGHSWSRDGVTFSNLTVGAFGPYITFENGTGWNNSYSERPLVTQNEDGSPLALYVGLGRTTYLDCCNWGWLFCTQELAEAGGKCGPSIRPE
eukprot:m.21068 g.21068  ORF g.21068 m.21068 type:complete len:467 (+) comp7023_c0_seq1:103-1503(+)